jgi:hypothetical protein
MPGYPTPAVDAAWAYITQEIRAGRPFPSSRGIAVHLGRPEKRPCADDALHYLLARGLVQRTYRKGTGPRRDWSLTRLGAFEIENRAEAAVQAEKIRKPRRTGSPKRVQHKPTSAHKKPSRQQRRETELRREQVTA